MECIYIVLSIHDHVQYIWIMLYKYGDMLLLRKT